MKTLFTLLAAGLFAFAATAQTPASTTKETKPAVETKTTPKYWCSQCDFSSATTGTCPTHNVSLIKEGMFFCKGDEAKATEKPGKCADGTPTARMDMGYQKKLKMEAGKTESDMPKATPPSKTKETEQPAPKK
ncbi:MAG TPA: hypothetical protein VI757_14020 [Bacteroidia bacterium]|nr:hypothetical protein [Bacteroidia bacterium]